MVAAVSNPYLAPSKQEEVYALAIDKIRSLLNERNWPNTDTNRQTIADEGKLHFRELLAIDLHQLKMASGHDDKLSLISKILAIRSSLDRYEKEHPQVSFCETEKFYAACQSLLDTQYDPKLEIRNEIAQMGWRGVAGQITSIAVNIFAIVALNYLFISGLHWLLGDMQLVNILLTLYTADQLQHAIRDRDFSSSLLLAPFIYFQARDLIRS